MLFRLWSYIQSTFLSRPALEFAGAKAEINLDTFFFYVYFHEMPMVRTVTTILTLKHDV